MYSLYSNINDRTTLSLLLLKQKRGAYRMGSAYVTGALIETRTPNWVVKVTSALHMRHFFHWAPQIFITWGEFRKGLDNQRKQKNVISEKIFSVLPLLNYCNYNGGLISASITYCEQASSFYPSCCCLNSSQLLEKKEFWNLKVLQGNW